MFVCACLRACAPSRCNLMRTLSHLLDIKASTEIAGAVLRLPVVARWKPSSLLGKAEAVGGTGGVGGLGVGGALELQQQQSVSTPPAVWVCAVEVRHRHLGRAAVRFDACGVR